MTFARRKRTPTLLQMEAVECGAAALGIILGFYGRHVPLEELRLRCGVSRDGSKATNILKAARGYGLEASGWRLEISELRTREAPYIVFWRFGHFLVVEGFGKDRVYLNDPATGPRWVTDAEFSSGYTGVALLFSKGAGFVPGGRRPGFLSALFPRLKGSGSGLLYVILAGLALAFISILEPVFRQLFIDGYLVGGIREWVPPLIGAMAASALIAALLARLELTHLVRLQAKLSVTTSSRFFWHVLRLPISFYSQRYAGEIGSRVALNESVASLLSGELATTAVTLCTMVFNLAMLGTYTWKLTLVGVGVGALNLVVLRLIAKGRADATMRGLQEDGKLTGVTMAGLQMMETIKAGGMEDAFFARFGGHQAAALSTRQSLRTSRMLLKAAPILLGQFNGMIMLVWGAGLAMRGELSSGMLAAFLSLMSAFIAPFGMLVELGGSIQDAQGTMRRIDDVLMAPLDAQLESPSEGSNPAAPSLPPGPSPLARFPGSMRGPDPAGAKTGIPSGRNAGAPEAPRGSSDASSTPVMRTQVQRLQGSLILEGISFGYSRLEEPFIRDFSLELQPGQRIALVGGSGSGKTTIAHLVCGLYEPWEGRILFDGRPRSAIPREVLVSSLARVSQDIHLFAGSCSDNIAMWDATIPEAWIQEAAEDACIRELIGARKDGFASPVGEAGCNFSGGERQRMEIARALATHPRILLLDEATSALDPVTEARIDSNLRRRGCTCLIVAHRLSTIRDCDEIIVMDKGRIAERGTHDRLVARGGRYAALVRE